MQLTDANGFVRARLTMRDDNPLFEMLGPEGLVTVQIKSNGGVGSVSVHDGSGKVRVEATVDDGEPRLSLLDERGMRRVSAVVKEDAPFLAFRNADGEPNIVLSSSDLHGSVILLFKKECAEPAVELGCAPQPSLVFRDTDGKTRLTSIVGSDGEVGVHVFDSSEIPRAFIGAEADGSASVRAMDDEGTTRVYLGAEEAAGTCRLELVDAEGVARYRTMLNPDGAPQAVMYAGESLPRMGSRLLPDGTPRTTLFDANGTSRLGFEVPPDAVPNFAVFDANGIRRVALEYDGTEDEPYFGDGSRENHVSANGQDLAIVDGELQRVTLDISDHSHDVIPDGMSNVKITLDNGERLSGLFSMDSIPHLVGTTVRGPDGVEHLIVAARASAAS
jgi:hypothetical protein